MKRTITLSVTYHIQNVPGNTPEDKVDNLLIPMSAFIADMQALGCEVTMSLDGGRCRGCSAGASLMNPDIRKAGMRVKATREKKHQAYQVLMDTPAGNSAFNQALENYSKALQLVHHEERYLATLVLMEMERTA